MFSSCYFSFEVYHHVLFPVLLTSIGGNVYDLTIFHSIFIYLFVLLISGHSVAPVRTRSLYVDFPLIRV